MPKNTLIILQENTGKLSSLPDNTPSPIRSAIESVVDSLAEHFEDAKNEVLTCGRYAYREVLTDSSCTRADLVRVLAAHAKEGRTIDLVFLGHGNNESIGLHGSERLVGGVNGNIRNLPDDAKSLCGKIPALRMVFSCSCWGATLNDDWRAAGAKVAIGALHDEWLAEPLVTFFLRNWMHGMTATDAAQHAWSDSIPPYLAVFPPKLVPHYSTVSYRVLDHGRWVSKEKKVFTGWDSQNNDKVEDSRLIVDGASQATCNY